MSRFEHAQNKSEFEEIRRSMLDRERGSATIAAWVPLRGGKMFQLMNVTYFYAPVDGSPFRYVVLCIIMSLLFACLRDFYQIFNLVHIINAFGILSRVLLSRHLKA